MILTKREKSKIRYIKKVICVIEHNEIFAVEERKTNGKKK